MLAARLHDVSAGLAVGVGLLKGLEQAVPGLTPVPAIDVFESVLADVTRLAADPDGASKRRWPTDLATELEQEAKRLGIELDLQILGLDDWLATDQVELLRLVGREAIRNVKRHSGGAQCRLTIDLADCPFVLRVRDWGAGISPGTRVGKGIERLRELASGMGCELVIGSQPGLGMELILVGRHCPRTRETAVGEAGLRSVVAKESLSSRRRVDTRRPIGGSGQQIT